MKPVTLYRFVRGVTHDLRFKWQWRVVWNHGNNQKVLANREEARRYKAVVPLVWKPRIQRRLVQATWEDYSDTFTYSAKGNGNGR